MLQVSCAAGAGLGALACLSSTTCSQATLELVARAPRLARLRLWPPPDHWSVRLSDVLARARAVREVALQMPRSYGARALVSAGPAWPLLPSFFLRLHLARTAPSHPHCRALLLRGHAMRILLPACLLAPPRPAPPTFMARLAASVGHAPTCL